MMDPFDVYKDIQVRTNGQFLIGVVGPVRTGKSTFVRKFMELLALPYMEEHVRMEVQDQLPLSGSGKMITTVEPKFIPKEAVELRLGNQIPVRLRLIDCVGFLIPGVSGNKEEEKERMVKTPWYTEEIPFSRAAEIGTQKVIKEHSNIGLVVTSDGSFGELPRENYIKSEERTVSELKEQGKPFAIVLNSKKPQKQETVQLAKKLEKKYQVAVVRVNCEQLTKEEITEIFEKVLYEFPVRQMEFYIPKWVEVLSVTHPVKEKLLQEIRKKMQTIAYIRDVQSEKMQMQTKEIKHVEIKEVNLSSGIVKIKMEFQESAYYQIMSEWTGMTITSEYQLMQLLKELIFMKEEYARVQHAMEVVRGSGYSVVIPQKGEITLEDPVVIRQGNKYGVKIKSTSPSIHMIKANIETEIAPIVGSQGQAEDLIAFIKESASTEDGIWNTNIFGKTVEQLVEDGIRAKIAQISEESQVKLQDTMQKIVNDSKGGMVCIII